MISQRSASWQSPLDALLFYWKPSVQESMKAWPYGHGMDQSKLPEKN